MIADHLALTSIIILGLRSCSFVRTWVRITIDIPITDYAYLYLFESTK